jgi:hypothetical protein
MDNPEEYYRAVLRDYPAVNNANARSIYFEQTEPSNQEPTHKRCLHVRRARAIASAMIAKVTLSVARNATLGVMRGTPLPHPDYTDNNGPVQPLADLENPLFDFLD